MRVMCVEAAPGPGMVYTLRVGESLGRVYCDVKLELQRLARFGINYMILKVFSPVVARCLRRMLQDEGFTVVSLPCKIVEIERFYISYNVLDIEE